MVRVTKEDYTRYRALEEAAVEFATMDYREARSELARWKTTFNMLTDKELYAEIRDIVARVDSGKAFYILKDYDLPDDTSDGGEDDEDEESEEAR